MTKSRMNVPMQLQIKSNSSQSKRTTTFFRVVHSPTGTFYEPVSMTYRTHWFNCRDECFEIVSCQPDTIESRPPKPVTQIAGYHTSHHGLTSLDGNDLETGHLIAKDRPNKSDACSHERNADEAQRRYIHQAQSTAHRPRH